MRYAKAVVGALVAGLGALATAAADGRVEPVEWIGVASVTLVALGAVWGVPNTPPDPAVALADHDARRGNHRR